MDSPSPTGNSDFRSGPLRTVSRGCIASRIPAILPLAPQSEGGDILTPTLSPDYTKKAHQMDSATIRMVRFSPAAFLLQPERTKHDLSACFSICCTSVGHVADVQQRRKTQEHEGAADPTNEPDSPGTLNRAAILSSAETRRAYISLQFNKFRLSSQRKGSVDILCERGDASNGKG